MNKSQERSSTLGYRHDFYGRIGDQVEVVAQLAYVKEFRQRGEPRWVVFLRTVTGHCLVSFETSPLKSAQVGDIVTVRGQVTKVDIYEGVHQTHIGHCQLEVHQSQATPEQRPKRRTASQGDEKVQEAWSALVSGSPVALKYVATILGTSPNRLFEVLREANLLRKVPSGHESVEGSEHLFKIEPVIYDDVVHLKPLVYLEAMPVVVKAWHEHGDR